MTSNNKVLVALWHFVVWFVMLNIRSGYGTISDVYCLKTFKESIGDPLGYLLSWNFNGTTEGSICKFVGIDYCWHDDENKVLNIKLAGFGLTGQFPSGLENCSSLTGLDLSSNNFTGFLPPQISQMLKFATSLDLSSNKFSGEIPENLANCTYLNVLRLNDNQLTGEIPHELGTLAKLKEFSVAKNHLHGQVLTNSTFTENSYASNPGLCGAPLKACHASGTNFGFIAGAAVGFIHAGIKFGFFAGAAVGFIASMFIVFSSSATVFLPCFSCYEFTIKFWSVEERSNENPFKFQEIGLRNIVFNLYQLFEVYALIC